MIPKDKTIKFTVTLGEKDYEDLRNWAHTHGKTAAEYAAQVLAARVEANLTIIETLIARASRSGGEQIK